MIHTQNADKAGTVKLSSAILLYTSGSFSNGQERGYATIHEVEQENGGAPVIKAGTALQDRQLRRILKSLQPKNKKQVGLLPENVLVNDEGLVVWWTKAQQRTAFFRTDDANAIGNASGKVHYPALLYVLREGRFSVFALKSTKRPGMDTDLFHAPLMNIFDTGGVCTGNVEFPRSVSLSKLKEWEDALLNSYFTHPNHSKVIKRYKGGVHQLYRDMLNGKHTKFPSACLQKFNITLGQLLNNIGES